MYVPHMLNLHIYICEHTSICEMQTEAARKKMNSFKFHARSACVGVSGVNFREERQWKLSTITGTRKENTL